MSNNATSQSSGYRPQEFSEDDGDTQVLNQEPEVHPLRSVEEILNERLDQREDRDEVLSGGEGPNDAGDRNTAPRADRGGIPDEDFPATEEAAEDEVDSSVLTEPLR